MTDRCKALVAIMSRFVFEFPHHPIVDLLLSVRKSCAEQIMNASNSVFLFREKRLKESLVQWWYYVRWRRGRKLTYQIADEHFKKVALPKYVLLACQNEFH